VVVLLQYCTQAPEGLYPQKIAPHFCQILRVGAKFLLSLYRDAQGPSGKKILVTILHFACTLTSPNKNFVERLLLVKSSHRIDEAFALCIGLLSLPRPITASFAPCTDTDVWTLQQQHQQRWLKVKL